MAYTLELSYIRQACYGQICKALNLKGRIHFIWIRPLFEYEVYILPLLIELMIVTLCVLLFYLEVFKYCGNNWLYKSIKAR